ncbi:MAG TPA: hypothetical protein VFZ66_26335 [Herpetosiphonaceae bacterium]
MSQPPRPIFRADAVRRYAERSDQAVLPRLIAPRTFLWLWLLAACLVGSAGAAWLVQVPIYASGRAVVLEAASSGHAVTAVVLLPPDTLPRLRPGQSVVVTSADRASQPITGALISIEPTITSPAEIQRRYAWHEGVAHSADRPSAVALARLDLPSDLPAAAYIGSRYRIDTAVGSRRVLSFLPVFGPLLGA